MKDKLEEQPSLKTLTGRTLMLVDTLQATVKALNEFSTRVMATLVLGAEQADSEIEALVDLGSIGKLYTQLLEELDTLQLEECCKQEVITAASHMCKIPDPGSVGTGVARALFRGNPRSRRYAVALNRLLVAAHDRQLPNAEPAPAKAQAPAAAPAVPAKASVPAAKPAAPVSKAAGADKASTPKASVLARLKEIKMAGRRTKGALTLIVTDLEDKKPVTDKQRKYLTECASKMVELAPLKTELVRLAQAT
jgi:hypothetical protein